MHSRIFSFLTCVKYETVADNRHAGLHSATFVHDPSSKQEIKEDIHQTQDHKTSPKMLNDCSKLVVRRNCKIKGRDYGTLNEIFERDRLNLYFSLWVNDFYSLLANNPNDDSCRKFLKLLRKDQSTQTTYFFIFLLFQFYVFLSTNGGWKNLSDRNNFAFYYYKM